MMKQVLPIFILLLYITTVTKAETFYVLGNGNDNNLGTENSEQGAWQTINHALDNLGAGDTLLIGDGLYLVQPIFFKNVHASAKDPTVIASQNHWGAKIRLDGNPEEGNVLRIEKCSYVEVDGLEIFAEAPNRGTGIEAAMESHHITIKNCYVHDCGCGGISGRGSDYITVERNVVRGNATRSKWNCSGISFLLPINVDDKPGYHMIIRNNVSFENECRLPFEHGGYAVPTDGNGIILDLFNNHINATDEGQMGGYRSATLIENNLCFNNGGRGINIFNSNKVTVRNNTSFHNVYVLAENSTGHGEIESYHAEDLEIYNNIFVENPKLNTRAVHLNVMETGKNILKNNIIVGSENYWPKATNIRENWEVDSTRQEYPKFINPTFDVEFNSVDDFKRYFGLMKKSPALNRALTEQAPILDLNQDKREKADIGCYER